MESSLPLIRASNMQQNLKSLSMFDPSISEQIKQQISEDVISHVNTAARSGWLPLELDIQVTEAVSTICGTEGLVDWSRESTNEYLLRGFLGVVEFRIDGRPSS